MFLNRIFKTVVLNNLLQNSCPERTYVCMYLYVCVCREIHHVFSYYYFSKLQ